MGDARKTRTGVPETRYRRTWYGLTAKVTLGGRFLHRAGFGGVEVPHPPLANWLLRIGLPGEARRRLSFAHEFAHFQTAPGALVYMIALFAVAHLRDRTGIMMTLLILASTQGFWEVLSEGLLVLEDPQAYRSQYENISMFARTIFWMAGAALTVAGWMAVMMQPPF